MKLDVAEVIINISVDALDRPFEYRIPDELLGVVAEGSPVRIPFGNGNRETTGFVIRIKDTSKWDRAKLKDILGVETKEIPATGKLLGLAAWIREHYGSTMNEAIRTVLPIRTKVKSVEKRWLTFVSEDNSEDRREDSREESVCLNPEQQAAVDLFVEDYRRGDRKTYLLYGVTGSGKTEVYMSMLQEVLGQGKQAIVLIPEISLTHQTVERFRRQFGDRISVLHSRMSQGERYEQYIRAKEGKVDVVVGPRSALFFPFPNPGLIILDEEHDGSYQSEKTPTYHAREVAIERARREGASVVLGSATPSVVSYRAAMEGRYCLLRMKNRATGAELPRVHVVDLREELKAKNKSVFSRLLSEKIRQRLDAKEQTMLFINRRGYAGFVSCRSCGFVIKCSHCDVSMTEHGRKNTPYLVCHYCGSTQPKPARCPECGSPYIAAFGLGTEQVADLVSKEFPDARVLRMDADTTKNKGGHERVLKPFRDEEADILVGTQMIVKGHDLPNVTLVGAIAADLSMYRGDYQSFENTYQLLLQAGGRAGRGSRPGEFVIQTYQPEAYCIQAIQNDDDTFFYENELIFRQMGGYPPYRSMLKILISSEKKEKADELGQVIVSIVDRVSPEDTVRIGPAPDELPFIKDRHRISVFLKSEKPSSIDEVIRRIENDTEGNPLLRDCRILYGRSPA
ncbi:MAG: primosomal protein N' [Eubacterium sp.]|nr:primosomal protein N' [Eubacterium sp.]